MRCSSCTTFIPPHAKYCPKCGLRVEGDGYRSDLEPPMSPHAHPARAPLPRLGKFVLAMLMIGGGLFAGGLFMRLPILCYVGIGLVVLLSIALVIGDHLGF